MATWTRLFGPAHDMWRCGLCASWSFFGDLQSAPEELYDEHYFSGGEYAGYEEGERAYRSNFDRLLALLQRHGRPLQGARLLEVGCATGAFLQLAQQQGLSAGMGVEPSEYARRRARQRGLDVLPPDDPDTASRIAALAPDVLVAWDVWEHLVKPATQLDSLLEGCAPDVTVALTTVDAGSWVARLRRTAWRQFHPPTHLHYPTRQGLAHYLTSRGFSVRYHASVGYFRPLRAYLRALALDRLALPGPLHALPVYLNLFDIQVVVACRGSARVA
jgi:cyclopropane fatty-acyl-phospholipid synthase-like methyltransferase